MSLPHPPGDPVAPPVPRTVPMPATPGSPLEPLRSGRRLDRRHWLLAGLLGILGGALLLDGAGLVFSLAANPQVPVEQLLHPFAAALLGLAAVIVAFASAPGSGGRRALGVVVVLVGIGLAAGYSYALFSGGLVPLEVRWVVSPQSILVGAGMVGWLLASGARWWAFLAVLLAPLVATVATALLLAGVSGSSLPSVLIAFAPYVLALVLALLTLALSIPRRR